MARKTAVSDETLTRILGGYAGLVHRVLTDPHHWLGLDEDPTPSAQFPVEVLDGIRDLAFGKVTPASASWAEIPIKQRLNWLLHRIAVSAGLAVCATAREYGITDAQAWIPLLAEVLLRRDLHPRFVALTNPDQAEQALVAASDPATPVGVEPARHRSKSAQLGVWATRAAGTVRELSRSFREVSSLLGRRPRGRLIFRAVGKIPVVGVVDGWLDERGGIRRASQRTSRLARR